MVNERRQLNQLRGMENKTPRQMQREQYLMRKQGVQPQPFQPMQAGGPGGMEPRFSQPFQPPQGWAQPNFANDKGFTIERGMGGGLPTEYGPMNGAYGQGMAQSFGEPPAWMRRAQNGMPGHYGPETSSQNTMQSNMQQMRDWNAPRDAAARLDSTQPLQAPGAVELQQAPVQRLTAPNVNYQNSQGSQQPRAQPSAPAAPGRLTAPNRNYINSQGSRQGRGLMAVKPPRV